MEMTMLENNTSNDKAHFSSILEEMTDIYLNRNKRYKNSFRKSFDKFGTASSCIRLYDKFSRFEQLSDDFTLETPEESIRDTLIDLANYSVLTIMEIDRLKDNTPKREIKKATHVKETLCDGLTLDDLVHLQREFQQSISNTQLPNDNPKLMQYHLSCATVEIAEILQLDERWKDWKKNPMIFDKTEKLEEFADVFIFMINALLFSGFNGKELSNMICDKINKNYKRQKEGY